MKRNGKYKSILKANLMLEQRFIGNGESSVLTEDVNFDTTNIDDMVKVINGKDISVKLEDGVVITGKPELNRNRLFQLSLPIKTENGDKYFSFYNGKFAMGGNEIVAGMNDESNDWLKAATKVYSLAEMKMYPEKFAKHSEEGERPIVILNTDDWAEEVGKLIMSGYKNSIGVDLDVNKLPMSQYGKYPFIIYVNDKNKTVEHRGEHTDLK